MVEIVIIGLFVAFVLTLATKWGPVALMLLVFPLIFSILHSFVLPNDRALIEVSRTPVYYSSTLRQLYTQEETGRITPISLSNRQYTHIDGDLSYLAQMRSDTIATAWVIRSGYSREYLYLSKSLLDQDTGRDRSR